MSVRVVSEGDCILLTCWCGRRGHATMGAERGMKEDRERNIEMCAFVPALILLCTKEGEMVEGSRRKS